jgi:citrate lyase subunit beta / citryl-CoA lyase
VIRPRRSALFMPGSNARALEKARTLPADALVLDLEDAVAPAMKAPARAQVLAAVRAGGYGGREIVIRVNALATPWGRDDLAAAAASGADAVLLPKAESAETVSAAMAVVGSAPAVWCMLETPRGILNAASIAAASPRVAALVMGTSDLTKDLHARTTRAAGITALDGFAAACRQAADLGFDGKTLIHPRQVATANEVFAPTASDDARRVLALADAIAERSTG